MAEEQGGLSYTIRFIPDTTAIDKSITEIAKRVEDEIAKGIRNARMVAGVEEGVPTGAAPIEGVGVVDRIISEFRSVKDKITGMMHKYGMFAGEALGLRHPADKTIGAVAERASEKLQAANLGELSLDALLQIASGVAIMSDRIKAIQELHPELSQEEAITMARQEPITSLKGIASDGIKQFAGIRGLDQVIRMADYYKRSLEETAAGREKGTEEELMKTFTHGIIQQVGTAILKSRGPAPDWESGGAIQWRALYQRWGIEDKGQLDKLTEEMGSREAADLVRQMGDVFELVEFGGAKRGGKFVADVQSFKQFLRDIATVPEMRAKAEEAGIDPDAIGGTVRMMTAGEFGGARAQVEGIKREDIIDEPIFEDIGEQTKMVMRASLIDSLTDFERDMSGSLLTMTDAPAKEYTEQLLEMIGSLLEVLRASSLPPLWKTIGVDEWIRVAAETYVGMVSEAIGRKMKEAVEPSDDESWIFRQVEEEKERWSESIAPTMLPEEDGVHRAIAGEELWFFDRAVYEQSIEEGFGEAMSRSLARTFVGVEEWLRDLRDVEGEGDVKILVGIQKILEKLDAISRPMTFTGRSSSDEMGFLADMDVISRGGD